MNKEIQKAMLRACGRAIRREVARQFEQRDGLSRTLPAGYLTRGIGSDYGHARRERLDRMRLRFNYEAGIWENTR